MMISTLQKTCFQIKWSCTRVMKSTSASHHGPLLSITTADPKDIETFSSFATKWWHIDGPMKGLHALNIIRVPYIVDVLMEGHKENANFQNKKVLDIGCGGGFLSEALAKYGVTVTGIDATKKLIDVAIQHCKTNKELKIQPQYFCTTIEDHSIERKNYYDCVVASEVVEHVINQELFVKACVETLKPGGKILFTTPTRSRLSQLINIWYAENIVKLTPKGTHQYEKFLTPDELQSLLELNGCHVEEIRGFKWSMAPTKWSWSRSKSLFFAMRAVK